MPSRRYDLDSLLDEVGMGLWQVPGLLANTIVWGLLAVHTTGSIFWNAPLEFLCCENPSDMRDVAAFSKTCKEQQSNHVNDSIYDSQCLENLLPDRANYNRSKLMGSTVCGEINLNNTYSGNATEIARYIRFHATDLDSCPLVAFNNSVYWSTVVTEWNLICEKSAFQSFFQDFYTLGMIIACIFGGDIGDRLMDESPRWLVGKGRLDAAAEAVWKATKVNKSKRESMELLKERMSMMIQPVESETTSSSLVAERAPVSLRRILSSRDTLYMLIVIPLVNFLNKIQFYTTFFIANSFARSQSFLYLGMTGVVDTIAVLSATFLITQFGRKTLTAKSSLLSGFLLLMYIFVPDAIKWLQWVLILSSFFLSSWICQALFVYTTELFPTAIRARGFALGSLLGNLGTLAAPFVPILSERYGWWIIGTTLCACGFIPGLILLPLPETRDEPMCETIDDVDRRRAKYVETRRGLL